jgi:mannitol-specific phosphotransferase system IIBC component
MKKMGLSIGTVSGTLCSTLPFINTQELLRTIILAAVGATVSFLVSFLLQKIRRKK